MSNKKKMWFACGFEQCTRVFKAKGLLERHTQTHQTYIRKIVHSDRRFKCELCPASFQQSANLIAHIYSHTAEKPFKCQYEGCNQAFSQKASLQRHAKALHLKPKSFKCPTCQKTFNFKQSLLQHLRVHTGIKPYACSFCSYKGSTRGSLIAHALRHHKEKQLQTNHESYPKCKNIVLSEQVSVKLIPLSKVELSKLTEPRFSKTETVKQEKFEYEKNDAIFIPEPRYSKTEITSKNLVTEKFKNGAVFKKRFKKNIEMPKWPCRLCSRIFTTHFQLGGHMKGHRNTKTTKSVKNVTTTSKTEYLNKIHSKPKKGRPVNTVKKLTSPAQEHPEEQKIPVKSKWEEPSKPFPCKHCGMSYSFQSYLDLHMMSHANSEAPMQTPSTNLKSVEEDYISIISDDEFSEVGSNNVDFDSRVSDIESVDSFSEGIEKKELYWPIDCKETGIPDTIINPVALPIEDGVPCSSNDISIQDPLLVEKEVLERIVNTVVKSFSFPEIESDLLRDYKNFDIDESLKFSKKELALGGGVRIGDKETISHSRENGYVKLENTNEDSFTIIDEFNDFHKALVILPQETKPDFTCLECGKKSRDQYLLYRHMQTRHNKGPQLEQKTFDRTNERHFKNEKAGFNELNSTSIKTEDTGNVTEEIENRGIGKYIESHRNQITGSDANLIQTNLGGSIRKPYACSCKKKFVREKALHKHLQLKMDSLPPHYRLTPFVTEVAKGHGKSKVLLAKNTPELLTVNSENEEKVMQSFSCGLCKRKHHNYDVLLRHVKKVHRKRGTAPNFITKFRPRRPDNVKALVCSICQTTFRRFGNLMRHKKLIHGIANQVNRVSNKYGNDQQFQSANVSKRLFSESNRIFLPNESNLVLAKKSVCEEFIDSPPTTEIISGSDDNLSGFEEKIYGESKTGERHKKSNALLLPRKSFSGLNANEEKCSRLNLNACNACPKIFISTYHLDLHKKVKHKRYKAAELDLSEKPEVITVEVLQNEKQNNVELTEYQSKFINVKLPEKKDKVIKVDLLDKPKIFLKVETAEKLNELIKAKSKSSKTFICPHNHCGRKYSSQIALNYHMLIHSDAEALTRAKEPEPTFTEIKGPPKVAETTDTQSRVCKICGNIFCNQFSLDRHMSNKFIHLPGYTRPSGFKRQNKNKTKLILRRFHNKKMQQSTARTRTTVNQKLKDLAELHCIPCSVFLERSRLTL